MRQDAVDFMGARDHDMKVKANASAARDVWTTRQLANHFQVHDAAIREVIDAGAAPGAFRASNFRLVPVDDLPGLKTALENRRRRGRPRKDAPAGAA